MKNEISIVVTDSGLGGLSVWADVYQFLLQKKVYKKVRLTFADALFDENSGYNKLEAFQDKIDIFNRALYGMKKNFSPDIILIACNTLSVLYPYTNFSETEKIQVFGIVNDGVKLIEKQLITSSKTEVVLFATQTTIQAGSHIQKLDERGADVARVIPKACPELQSYIEREPEGAETMLLIQKYVDEVLPVLKMDKVSISLNCTHYGYALPLWKQAFKNRNIHLEAVVNPNSLMVEKVSPDKENHTYNETEIELKMITKVPLPEQNKQAMVQIFKNISPDLAETIDNYELLPDYF